MYFLIGCFLALALYLYKRAFITKTLTLFGTLVAGILFILLWPIGLVSFITVVLVNWGNKNDEDLG